MTVLSQNEKEDLHNVFASISDVKPSRFSIWKQLKLFIYFHGVSHFKTQLKKPTSYRK